MSEETPLLSVRGLCVAFRGADDTAPFSAVEGVSFDLRAGGTVALVGESGSGKSVSALAIMGLLPPNAVIDASSSIRFDGRELLGMPPHARRQLRGRAMSMIFQEPMSSLNPVFTVGFQIVEVLRQHLPLTRSEAKARAIELLDEVGIPDARRRFAAYPFELSGGQQQRVMIAMAIACEPRLLIADEPTTALDVTIQKQILQLVAELQQRRGMSVLFITHDLALVSEIAYGVVVMQGGRVREEGSVRQVFNAPRDAYTAALLACRPSVDARPARLPVIADFLGKHAARAPAPARNVSVNLDAPPLLEARGLSKSFYRRDGLFSRAESRVVSNASFTLRRGKTLGVVGESGSGKTTLALMLMRLTEPTAGTVVFEGEDLALLAATQPLELKRRIQIVFQNPYASLNPRFTAGEILEEPMRIHRIGRSAAERRSVAYRLLDEVGLPRAAFFKYPHEFSGGQRQRIAIARCLTLRPDVLICDESVSALDVSVQAQLLNLLKDLQDEYGMSYIFISHDLAVVRYMSDEVMVMNEGEVVEIASADDIYNAPKHSYTRQLLASMPRISAGAPSA